MPDQREIRTLTHHLQEQLERVKANAAFLTLKEGEVRDGSQLAIHSLLEAQEQYAIEKSLLAGHTFLIENMLLDKAIHPHPQLARLLSEARNCARLDA